MNSTILDKKELAGINRNGSERNILIAVMSAW